ncbi:MAG: sigma-70 family RNA polymerase sigma factor [Pyrinomonadaceae bacterium]
MDNLLLPYLSANEESERQQRLDELLTVRAAPIVRQTLRRRLGFYVSAQGINERNQDAEDLYQEAMTRIVQVLHDLHASSSGTDIDNFDHYVARIASNTCIDFLRAKSPARTRLKDSLRDLFRRHKDLVSWEYEKELLCGFAVWRNTGKTVFSGQASRDIETKTEAFRAARFPDEDVRAAPLPQVAAELFDWIGGPVEIDVLVRIVASLLDVREQPIESLDDDISPSWNAYFAGTIPSSESTLQAKELLRQLWRAIIQLPPEQRDAFCLGFEDQAGQDLFSALLGAGIVTLKDLANGLGRSVEEVGRLRSRVPMDSATVAAELNASRDNVYKWRFRAVQRLKVELDR